MPWGIFFFFFRIPLCDLWHDLLHICWISAYWFPWHSACPRQKNPRLLLIFLMDEAFHALWALSRILTQCHSWFKYNISFCIIQMFWRKSWLRQFVLALHIFKDINYSNVQVNDVIIVMYIICMEHILSLFSRPKWNHFNAFNCTFYHLLTVVSCVRPFKYAPLHVCLWLSNLCSSHPPPLVWGAGCNSPWDSVAPITRAVNLWKEFFWFFWI